MAKGSVTDQELESSLKSLGGLGGITSSGARRDSPFGSDFVKKTASEVAIEAPKAEPEVVKTVELRSVPDSVSNVAELKAPSPEIKRVSAPIRSVAEPKPRPTERAKPVEIVPEMPARKSDGFSERVTLQMGPEMRDELNLLAAKLQRRKTDKTERITANTIMRVAIRVLLDEVDLGEGDIANNEEDLLRIVRAKLTES
jgi:hypothetical protein